MNKFDLASQSPLGVLESLFARCQQQLLEAGYCCLSASEQPSPFSPRAFLRQFGDFAPQYDGEIEYAVKSAQGYAAYSDSRSTNDLKPHTDGSDFEPPPRWLALVGVQAATCGGGHTLLMDGHQWLRSLPKSLQTAATTQLHWFGSSQGLHASRPYRVHKPILDSRLTHPPVLRFSYNLLMFGDYSAPIEQQHSEADPLTQEICHHLIAFHERQHRAFLLDRGDLLLWDNWRMVHSRTAYRDRHRHLLRYWLSAPTPQKN